MNGLNGCDSKRLVKSWMRPGVNCAEPWRLRDEHAMTAPGGSFSPVILAASADCLASALGP